MLKEIFIGLAALTTTTAIAQGLDRHATNISSAQLIERTARQSKRLDALEVRGKNGKYQELTRIVARSSFDFPSEVENVDATSLVRFQALTLNETAINLAALGFTRSDVIEQRRRGVDLVAAVNRLFTASASFEDTALCSDTILVAEAGNELTHIRNDGNLSTLTLKVKESLKGTTQPGDTILIPPRSGPVGNGTSVSYSSDLHFKQGANYLLLLSKNWYAQRVAERGKAPETGNNTETLLAFEIKNDGSLISVSHQPQSPAPATTGEARNLIHNMEITGDKK